MFCQHVTFGQEQCYGWIPQVLCGVPVGSSEARPHLELLGGKSPCCLEGMPGQQ